MLTKDQIRRLREPFKPEQVKHKTQVNPKNEKDEGGKKVGWGTVVFYLDSRDVSERLDLVTEGQWEDEYNLFGKDLECTLTVCGVKRRDVGEGGKAKDLYSDAFKRAAVKFGVGAFLYRLPNVLCKMQKGSRGIWELTAEATKSLSEMKRLAGTGGSEVWPKKFAGVYMISEFQQSEDFSEPEKEEDEQLINTEWEKDGVKYRVENVTIREQVAAKGQNFAGMSREELSKRSTDYRRAQGLEVNAAVIVNEPGKIEVHEVVNKRPVPVERDTLLPEGEPESPEHDEEEEALIPPPVPASESGEFMGKVSEAKKALGVPLEQKPVKWSSGDGPMTQEERKKLMATLNSFEVKGKESVIDCLSFLLKRPLESSTEISQSEARGLINGLSVADVEAWRENYREDE